jgi:hypothetical protein
MHNAQLSEVPRLYLLRNLRRAKERPEVASTGTAKEKKPKQKILLRFSSRLRYFSSKIV